MSFSQIVPEHIQHIPPYKSENPAEQVERKLGVPVVQLGMNENPFGPSPKAVQAARAVWRPPAGQGRGPDAADLVRPRSDRAGPSSAPTPQERVGMALHVRNEV